MPAITTMQKRFAPDVYPAMYDTTSEMYKLVKAIADEIDAYRDALTNMATNMTIIGASAPTLRIVSSGFGVEQFAGEDDSVLQLKFAAFRGMPVSALKNLAEILGLFCVSIPVVTEPAPNQILVTLPRGSSVYPQHLLCIGSDGIYGSAINDSEFDTAGTLYSNVNSAIIVSRTYLEYIAAQIKPAGTTITIVEES